MGKFTISMAMFNSYVSLPEGSEYIVWCIKILPRKVTKVCGGAPRHKRITTCFSRQAARTRLQAFLNHLAPRRFGPGRCRAKFVPSFLQKLNWKWIED
jgi:hypothetical protein